MRLYALYDTYAEEFMPLFEARNDALALRAISGLPDTAFPQGTTREDFVLYKLGFFDRDKMCIIPKEKALRVFAPYKSKEVENEAV